MLKLKQKLALFQMLCGDWNYREIDMANPHLSSISIVNGKIVPSCEIYSSIIDDYVICEGNEIDNKSLIHKFKRLDITNRNDVLNFIYEIENRINWNEVENDLYEMEKILEQELENNKEKNLEEKINNQYIVVLDNEKIIFESKKLALSYYSDLAWMYDDEQKEKYKHIYNKIEKTDKIYSDNSEILSEKYFSYDDYESMDAVMAPCKLLGDGWVWKKYNDGSGHLKSPDGKSYMEYDLQTKEYKFDENSWWSSYVEGYEEIPNNFNFFRMAEEEMKEYISKENKNNDNFYI